MIARFTFGLPADAEPGHAQWFSLPSGAPANTAMELGTRDFRTIAPGRPVELNALGTGESYDFHVRLRETRPTVRGGRFSRPVKLLVEYL